MFSFGVERTWLYNMERAKPIYFIGLNCIGLHLITSYNTQNLLIYPLPDPLSPCSPLLALRLIRGFVDVKIKNGHSLIKVKRWIGIFFAMSTFESTKLKAS